MDISSLADYRLAQSVRLLEFIRNYMDICSKEMYNYLTIHSKHVNIGTEQQDHNPVGP